jgi:hypothetical protein
MKWTTSGRNLQQQRPPPRDGDRSDTGQLGHDLGSSTSEESL